MTYNEIEQLLKKGKVGQLPNYKGYFHWSWILEKPYMKNGDYVTYNIDDLKTRNDWFYII